MIRKKSDHVSSLLLSTPIIIELTIDLFLAYLACSRLARVHLFENSRQSPEAFGGCRQGRKLKKEKGSPSWDPAVFIVANSYKGK